jgi:hypothetical protein
MDDKLIIHLNKNLANIKTNKNNELIYNLKEPIQLNPMDTVSLYKAFLDVRGQSQNTVTLDQDFEEEILFGFYIPQTPGLEASPYTPAQQLNIPFNRLKTYQQMPTQMISSVVNETPVETLETSTNELDFNYNPPTNSPCPMITLLDTALPDGSGGNTQIEPGVGNYTGYNTQPKYTASSLYATDTRTIKISAGNYQVDELASMITAQMNGQTTADNLGENVFFNKDKKISEDPTNISGSNIVAEVVSIASNLNQFLSGPYRQTNTGHITLQGVKDYVANQDYKTGVQFLDLGTCARQLAEYNTFAEEGTRPTSETYETIGGLLYPIFTEEDATNGGMRLEVNVTRNGETGLPYDTTMICTSITDAAFRNSLNQVLQWKDLGTDFATYDVKFSNQYDELEKAFVIQLGNVTQYDKTFETNDLVVISDTKENARTIGTKSFLCSFGDSASDRFTISNLHEPFRVPTYGQSNFDNKVVANGSDNVGNQATNFQLKRRMIIENRTPAGGSADISGCYYPQECSSGIYILSWSNKFKKLTQKYKDALAKRDALTTDAQSDEYIALTNYLNINPHDYFYGNNEDPEADWEQTLWSRLGFTYENFGKVSTTQEEYFTFKNIYDSAYGIGTTAQQESKYKMLGTISHNDASISMATALSGLGKSLIPPDQSSAYQTFGTMGTLEVSDSVKDYPARASGDGKNINLDTFMPYENIYLLATSKPITASTLPNLTGGSNYFVIQSDVIKANSLDVYGDKNTVVGFVSKENSSADTIFSVESIPFTITQPRLLNSINVRVVNPDGTDVSDDILKVNSAFIFMIDRKNTEIVV